MLKLSCSEEVMAEKLGILGRKLGMTRIFTAEGRSVPVTVIEAGPCPVVQVKDMETDGYDAIQIAFGEDKEKHVTKPLAGHFKKAGTSFFRNLSEIRLNNPAEQAVGDVLDVTVFEPGEMVKVTGTSIGKGFQGVMKRYNFRGACASHGAEKNHRGGGSIGNASRPSKVWKGRKMAGQMGNKQVTAPSVTVVAIRPEENIILVKGSIPGPKRGLVMVRKK